jgi:hypothetical protein
VAIAGDWGTATAGHDGTAVAGTRGVAMAGDCGVAMASEYGIIQIRWWDGARARIATGYVGEDGIEPNVAYHVVDGRLTKKESNIG